MPMANEFIPQLDRSGAWTVSSSLSLLCGGLQVSPAQSQCIFLHNSFFCSVTHQENTGIYFTVCACLYESCVTLYSPTLHNVNMKSTLKPQTCSSCNIQHVFVSVYGLVLPSWLQLMILSLYISVNGGSAHSSCINRSDSECELKCFKVFFWI